eukprot:CAMPEP_0113883886 /NCGR_PEP_ID=MMETSP0780_2-20120614/9884_1 /TAXON_ID=652834 /ORGANISM="Palpitomonas bilix" /LENGTH=259 /DNA_ID=CAMNT_0000871311 /DNA_START=380 /DNA_END=1159 /DNA_ORIENTATION=+ /assembly_acc=CAM_ASM_000599
MWSSCLFLFALMAASLHSCLHSGTSAAAAVPITSFGSALSTQSGCADTFTLPLAYGASNSGDNCTLIELVVMNEGGDAIEQSDDGVSVSLAELGGGNQGLRIGWEDRELRHVGETIQVCARLGPSSCRVSLNGEVKTSQTELACVGVTSLACKACVADGATLHDVASRWGTSWRSLFVLNELSHPTELGSGAVLSLGNTLATVNASPFDTLHSISQTMGASVESLKRWNPKWGKAGEFDPLSGSICVVPDGCISASAPN